MTLMHDKVGVVVKEQVGELRTISYEMKISAFWDTTPCSLVEADRRFRGAYCLHHQVDYRPDDGGSKHH
jgi:hypothetical protein